MAVPAKVNVGGVLREFPGASFNALIDARSAQHAAMRSGGVASTSVAASSGVVAMVKNSSGAAREPGEILGIKGPMFPLADAADQVYAAPVVEGEVPLLATHKSKIGVCLDYIPSGAVGRCVISGAAWAKCEWPTSEHKYAEIKDSDATKLTSSATAGIVTVWHDTSWALVLLGGGAGGGDTKIVKITGTVSARSGTTRGSGTCVEVDENLATVTGGITTVYNSAAHKYEPDAVDPIYCTASKIGAVYFLDDMDYRGLRGWDNTKEQSIGHDHATTPGSTDDSQLPSWQDDADCFPEA